MCTIMNSCCKIKRWSKCMCWIYSLLGQNVAKRTAYFEYQVFADFDTTLTWNFNNGSGQSRYPKFILHYCNCYTIPSLFHFPLVTCTGSQGLLKQGNPEYDTRRRALFEYYHPLELKRKLSSWKSGMLPTMCSLRDSNLLQDSNCGSI